MSELPYTIKITSSEWTRSPNYINSDEWITTLNKINSDKWVIKTLIKSGGGNELGVRIYIKSFEWISEIE